MVRLQGGSPGSLDDPRRLPTARIMHPFRAPRSGYVAGVDADAVGRAVLVLGAGRTRTDDAVDHAVGVTRLRKIGEPVRKGDDLVMVHANDKDKLRESVKLLSKAFAISAGKPRVPKLILEAIR
jgi:pyrimidine-nucleoside phosphorylase